MATRIGKRLIDALEVNGKDYIVWDDDLPGFGVRVRSKGAKSFVFQYRAGAGRTAPTRRFTFGSTSKLTPDQARALARKVSGEVAGGDDPAKSKSEDRHAITVAGLIDLFVREHVKSKCKPSTAENYELVLRSMVIPELGSTRVTKLHKRDVARVHLKRQDTPYQANNMIRVLRSMYNFAAGRGLVPESFNPARGIVPFKQQGRERFLSNAELERLGASLELGESEGIPWVLDPDAPNAKHVPKQLRNQRTKIEEHAAAAIRLLLFTGCRMREILHLQWSQVDLERGLLFLSDSKTGRKAVILNTPAIRVLQGLSRIGTFVIAGECPDKPRHDLKRPWFAVTRHAGLQGLRIHDLRHNFASFGASGGMGLPIIGKLLGHSQPSTTARYAHLDTDPLRAAADKIAGTIAAALEGRARARNVVKLNQGKEAK
jgi:integrase